MTQEELEALTQQYLATSFDEIESRLALDWTPVGLDEHSSQLNEQCHALSAALATADLSSTIESARELAPNADEMSQRKLARRMIEAQLTASIAEIRAIAGAPLVRPTASPATSTGPKVTVKAGPRC